MLKAVETFDKVNTQEFEHVINRYVGFHIRLAAEPVHGQYSSISNRKKQQAGVVFGTFLFSDIAMRISKLQCARRTFFASAE